MSNQFPNNLKRCRKKAGLSQLEVAGFLELNNSSNISRWEKGNVLPGLIHLYHLSLLYKVPPSDLYPAIWNFIKTEMDSKIREYERKSFISVLENFNQ